MEYFNLQAMGGGPTQSTPRLVGERKKNLKKRGTEKKKGHNVESPLSTAKALEISVSMGAIRGKEGGILKKENKKKTSPTLVSLLAMKGGRLSIRLKTLQREGKG